MTMKDFIEQEKRRLQESLHWFNSRGSRMTVRESGDLFLDTLVDSFTVTRIAPHFDAAGNHLRTDFWLLWKALGYDERFIRLWRFYLAYCEAGFNSGDVDVHHYVFAHAGEGGRG